MFHHTNTLTQSTALSFDEHARTHALTHTLHLPYSYTPTVLLLIIIIIMYMFMCYYYFFFFSSSFFLLRLHSLIIVITGETTLTSAARAIKHGRAGAGTRVVDGGGGVGVVFARRATHADLRLVL